MRFNFFSLKVAVLVSIIFFSSLVGVFILQSEDDVSEIEVGFVNEDGERVPFKDDEGGLFSVVEDGELLSMWESSEMEEMVEEVYAVPKVKVEAENFDSVEISGDVLVEGYWLDEYDVRRDIYDDSDEFSETISSDDFGDWVTLDSGESTFSVDEIGEIEEAPQTVYVCWDFEVTGEANGISETEDVEAGVTLYYTELEDWDTSYKVEEDYDYLSVIFRGG